MRFVLWGCHPLYGPRAIKIAGGTAAHCIHESQYRAKHGWTGLAIYQEGTPYR